MHNIIVVVQAGIHYSDAIWIPTLATLGQGLFMTLSGHLEDRVGIRYVSKLSVMWIRIHLDQGVGIK